MANNPFQVLATTASQHLRITHNALSNPARAEDLLFDRMLDLLQDFVDGDVKSYELDQVCEQICGMPGPMITIQVRKHANERIDEIRRTTVR